MRPEVGAVYQLGEVDYRFGLGALLVKVTKVVNETVFDNEPWWDIEALVRVLPNGIGPGQERRLYVREASLTRARQTGCT
jgi:hypothetical protein